MDKKGDNKASKCEASPQTEIPLIYEKGTTVNSYFELQKEGIQFLQRLEDEKVRVVFHVSTSIDIHPFVSAFCTKGDVERLKNEQEGIISSLSLISRTEKSWEDSRLLTVKCTQQHANQGFLLFGYLVASLFVYHT